MKASILLVEDERELAEGLADALGGMGYDVECVHRGDQGLERARQDEFDLLILDVMLPGLSGFDLLAKLRRDGDETLVLMLTARGQEVDKVRGLRAGADDYMSKPFGLMELTARVEALLRRHPRRTRAGGEIPSSEEGTPSSDSPSSEEGTSFGDSPSSGDLPSSGESPASREFRAGGRNPSAKTPTADDDGTSGGGVQDKSWGGDAEVLQTVQEEPLIYRAGKVSVDFQAREGRRGGRTFTLTGRELEVLQALARHAGRPVSRNDLISAIWGISDDVEVTTRTIDQHVASLRRKLEADPSSPELLETVYGYGYRLKKGD